MTTLTLPPPDEMYGALLRRDATYDGVFFTGVRTTGIFCKPTCPARKPLREHVEFFRTAVVCGGSATCWSTNTGVTLSRRDLFPHLGPSSSAGALVTQCAVLLRLASALEELRYGEEIEHSSGHGLLGPSRPR